MVPTLSSPLLFTVRVALVAVVLLAGCAAPASSLSADEAFGRIQRYEAVIAHSTPGTEGRPLRCEAARDLCRVASDLGDPDALARCEAARRRCEAGR